MSPAGKRLPQPESVQAFNPLEYKNLTKNVVDELMRQEPLCLPLERRFAGAGVYALFYRGDDPEYISECSKDATRPIYVGKAVPAGARKGVSVDGPVGTNLYDRIGQHTASIEAVADLKISEFLVRYLVVQPLWIVMAEVFLITEFKPLWNLHLDGFGNHNPGKGRQDGEISWWDARHPGRSWAASLRPTKTQEQAKERVREFHRLAAADPLALQTLAKEAAAEEAARD